MPNNKMEKPKKNKLKALIGLQEKITRFLLSLMLLFFASNDALAATSAGIEVIGVTANNPLVPIPPSCTALNTLTYQLNYEVTLTYVSTDFTNALNTQLDDTVIVLENDAGIQTDLGLFVPSRSTMSAQPGDQDVVKTGFLNFATIAIPPLMQQNPRIVVYESSEDLRASSYDPTVDTTLQELARATIPTSLFNADCFAPPAPTVSMTSDSAVARVNGPVNITATFSEQVSNFDVTEIALYNATISDFTGDGTIYTFTVTPTQEGQFTYTIETGDIESASGGVGLASSVFGAGFADFTAPGNFSASFVQNSITPTNVTSASISYLANDHDSYSYNYTISSSNGGSDVTGSGLIGPGDITGIDLSSLNDGTLTLSFTVTDEAGNVGSPHTSTIEKDTIGPSVVLSVPSSSVSGAFSVTATFSEDVTGFDISDVVVGNGTASDFVASSAAIYTFVVTPTSDGDVTVDVAASVAQDTATNGNTAAAQLSVGTDATAPTVTLTSNVNPPHSGAFTVTATFSEDVTGFDISDVVVGNGSASDFVASSAAIYTFVVTPTSDGDVTVDVAANVAQDTATNGNTAAAQLSVGTDSTAPTVTVNGPNNVVTEEFNVTIRFSEVVNGFASDDITVANGRKGELSGSGSTYILVVTPEIGATVVISVAANVAEDAAGNGNQASNLFEVQAGSPAAEFARHEAEIRQVIVDDARRSLSSTLAGNRNLSREARTRFMTSHRQISDDEGTALVSRNNVAFDIDGMAEISGSTFSTNGTFFEQTGNFDGTYRRLFFGDFDVQHDTDTGSTTATLSGKIAWEHMVSEHTMLGYYIGGELGRSQIDGPFEGDQSRYGVSVGGYFVSALQENLFADGFVSLGVGRNDLEMGNGTLDLESDYITHTLTLGTALTGVIEREGYEIWPELAFTYGKTFIGDVEFTGHAYGLVDNDLSLDAGNVSIANLTFRPEFRVPMDGLAAAESRNLFSFAPRLLCEQIKTTVTTEDCGGGAEIGWISASENGMTNLNARLLLDRIGNSTRSGLQLNFEHRF